jgi:hypothetical protein
MRKKQVFPTIWLKVGPLVVITNWPHRLPIVRIKFPTLKTSNTYFSTSLLCKKIIGPIFFVREMKSEVLKEEDDVTHPNFDNTEKGKQMKAATEAWLRERSKKED